MILPQVSESPNVLCFKNMNSLAYSRASKSSVKENALLRSADASRGAFWVIRAEKRPVHLAERPREKRKRKNNICGTIWYDRNINPMRGVCHLED